MLGVINLRRNANVFLFSVIWPIYGLIQAILHPRNPSAKNLIWLFIIYYGVAFYVSTSSGSDSVRYAELLSIMHNSGFGLDTFLNQLYIEGYEGSKDLYQPLVTFIVSRFSDEHWILFGTFGVTLGYVYSRNLWFMIDRLPSRPGLTLWLLVVAFAFIMGVGTSLNGVRMWTALHVFIFGILHFSATGKSKFLLVALITPFIHFSFFLASAILIFFVLLNDLSNKYLNENTLSKLVFIFFIASFVFSIIDYSSVSTLSEYLPSFLVDKVSKGYIDKADPSNINALDPVEVAWFLRLNELLFRFFIILVSCWLYTKILKSGNNISLLIFNIGLFSYGIVNLISFIPSTGRFFKVGEMLIVASLVLFLSHNNNFKKYNFKFIRLMVPILIFYIAIGIRYLFEFSSPWLLLGNFFIIPMVGSDLNLYEFILNII